MAALPLYINFESKGEILLHRGHLMQILGNWRTQIVRYFVWKYFFCWSFEQLTNFAICYCITTFLHCNAKCIVTGKLLWVASMKGQSGFIQGHSFSWTSYRVVVDNPCMRAQEQRAFGCTWSGQKVGISWMSHHPLLFGCVIPKKSAKLFSLSILRKFYSLWSECVHRAWPLAFQRTF